MLRKPFFIALFLTLAFLLVGGWFFFRSYSVGSVSGEKTVKDSIASDTRKPMHIVEKVIEDKDVFFNVPFTPQAPFGEWSDPRQDYACEESSVIMAMHWVRGTNLTLTQAKEEILSISDYEEKEYGVFRDTSARDTMERIIKGYFNYQNVELYEDIDTTNIKAELLKGNLILVPINGRKLNNPYYTPPGPIEHMVVVTGYDSKTEEFIINDPGTKNGGGMRVSDNVLSDSLRDYLTGWAEPLREVSKVMIVISPR